MVKIVLTLGCKGEKTGGGVVRAIEKLLKEKGEWTIEKAIEARTELKPVTTKRVLDPTNDWEEAMKEEMKEEMLQKRPYHPNKGKGRSKTKS